MDSSRVGRRSALALAVLALASVVPLSVAGVGQASCSDELTVSEYITTGTPLDEQLTATEVLYLLVAPNVGALAPNRHLVNGIDAVVVDLGCTVTSATFSVTATSPVDDCDPAVKFYDSALRSTGVANTSGASGEAGAVPVGSAYAVIILEDGPIVSGTTPTLPLRPYSCRVLFEMSI